MNDLQMCFACGEDNPIGLKLNFVQVLDHVEADFIPADVHQGYTGMMHGGLVTTLLDEAMAKVLNLRGLKAVTATLEVKFRNPVPIGAHLKIVGELVEERQRRCSIKAHVEDARGKVLAEASSVFIKLS